MNEFEKDNNFQLDKREIFLKPFYIKKAHEGRFVFCDKGQLANLLNREMAIDTILQKDKNEIIGIEEKIVRWPGYNYTAFTLETMSCTVSGHERKGWMYTAQCDILFYCFCQEETENKMESYAIPFRLLQKWFFTDERYLRYKTTYTEQINHTECRIVPIEDVMTGVPSTKFFILETEINIKDTLGLLT